MEVEKGLPLAVNALIFLVDNFRRLGTHTEEDFKMILNLPKEFGSDNDLLDLNLKKLERNNINYMLVFNEDKGIIIMFRREVIARNEV